MTCTAIAQASSSAVILQYHHVANDTPASTTVSPEQFRQHMQYLQRHYQVWPLDKLIDAVKKDNSVPDNVVAITFDDGYLNILQNAAPILKEFQFPYTIFINPDEIGKRDNQLDWQQVKAMADQQVLFANHSNGHLHLLQRQSAESEQAWLERISNNILAAEDKLEQELGYSLKYLAYPYGEYNSALQSWLKKSGYTGFGQHSGAFSTNSDFSALPRYPAAGVYASLDSLKVKLASLALPVKKNSIKDPEFQFGANYPDIQLQLDSDDFNRDLFACFLKGQRLKVDWSGGKAEIVVGQAMPVGRSRINCTVPSKTKKSRYYWYSQPFFVADKNGNWLN
ncbi:polysaccharide deacetylase family protein [Neptunicella sp. SCSIO 80796]|uniref:polysaccharide deacetylase family protein n=1 Tax=Neptunicella plasticusilytica TaxID=3117012 RepID=UPI003A4D4B0E